MKESFIFREGATENRMISLEPYLQLKIKQENASFYKEYPLEFAASTLRKGMDAGTSGGIVGSFAQMINNFNYDVKFADKSLKVDYVDYTVSKQGQADMGLLTVNLTLNGKTENC